MYLPHIFTSGRMHHHTATEKLLHTHSHKNGSLLSTQHKCLSVSMQAIHQLYRVVGTGLRPLYLPPAVYRASALLQSTVYTVIDHKLPHACTRAPIGGQSYCKTFQTITSSSAEHTQPQTVGPARVCTTTCVGSQAPPRAQISPLCRAHPRPPISCNLLHRYYS